MTRKPSERRKFWLAAGSGLGVVLLMALIVPRLIDWNSYKPEIETLASKVTDRSVHVDGPLEVALLPLPAVTIHKLRVANLPGGVAEDMAKVNRLEVRIAILPLFFGELAVSKLIFHEPVIALEVLADGQENWRLGKKRKFLEKSSERIPNLKLKRFAVKNGIITYREAGWVQPEDISGVTLDLEARSFDGPFKADGKLVYREVPISFDFAMSRKGLGGKTPFKGTLQFARATLDTSGIADWGEEKTGTEPSYSGTTSINSSNVGETLTALQMIAGATEVSGLTLSEPMTADFRLTASADRIETRGLTLTLGESKGTGQLLFDLGEQPRADISLNFSTIASDVLLQAMPPRDVNSPPITLADIFEALDPGAIVGEVTLSADEIRQGQQVIRQAEIKLAAAEGKLIIKKFHALLPGASDVDVAGILTSGETPRFDGRIVTASNNLRSLLDWMDVEIKGVPPGRLTAFAIVSNLSVDKSGYHFSDALFRLDDMTARGDVTYAPGTSPAIGVTATADRLSLGNYLAPGSDCVGGGATDDMNKRSFNTALAPTDMFDIGNLTLTLDLRVDTFSCRPITGNAVAINATLTGGRFELATFKAKDLLGLEVDGKGHMQTVADTLRFDFKLSATGQSLAGLGQAFPELLPVRPEKASGKVALKGNVEGTLEDLRLHMAGQAGRTAVTADAELGFANKRKVGRSGLLGMKATVTAKGPSFAAFADQWDYGLTAPTAADDKPFSFTAGFRGTPQKADVDFTGDLAGGTVSLTGLTRELRDLRTYEFALKIKGSDTRSFVRGLGFDVARDAHGLGPIEISGTVISDPRSIAIEQLSGQIGPMQMTGGLQIERGTARRRITGDIKAGTVDLDRLLGDSNPQDGPWSREPYRLDRLTQFDSDLQISADSILMNGFLFDQPRLKLVMDKGKLEIKQMTGGLFGGRVAINYVYGPQGASGIPGIGLGFALRQASLQQALEGTMKVGAVSGTFDIQGTLAAVGASPYDLVRGLQGQASFGVGPGIVSNLDMPGLVAKLKSTRDSAALGDVIASSLSSGETEHKGMTGTLIARKGVITLYDTAAILDGGRAVLAVNADLPAWTLWSSGRLELTELATLPPVGLIISGSLDQPQIRFQSRDLLVKRTRQLGGVIPVAPKAATPAVKTP